MLNSHVTASPGREHVPASERWVQTAAASELSFSPFLHGTRFKTGVSLLCKLSLVQGHKSWASHSPLPLSLSPPTASTAAAKETFAFSPQESEGRFLLQGVMQAHLSSDKVISTPGPQAKQIRTF